MNAAARRRSRMALMLLFGAALSSALAVFALWPKAAPPARREVGALVAPLFSAKASEAATVTVATAEETYHLSRTPTGWVEPERGGYRVPAGRIADFLRAIETMKFAAPMTRDEKKLNRIGLGDPKSGGVGALVEIADVKGATLFKMVVGFRNDRTYVREPDDLQAWAVAAEPMPPLLRAARWLDLDVVDVAPSAIREVEIALAGRPAYRLAPKDPNGDQFAPLAPYDQFHLAASLAPTLPGQALTHFAPIDVAPAAAAKSVKPIADHITRTKSGLEVTVHALKLNDRGWTTLSARTLPGASIEAIAEAQRINERAQGWLFELSANDWSAYATPIEAVVDQR